MYIITLFNIIGQLFKYIVLSIAFATAVIGLLLLWLGGLIALNPTKYSGEDFIDQISESLDDLTEPETWKFKLK